jgi:hypothetical protein
LVSNQLKGQVIQQVTLLGSDALLDRQQAPDGLHIQLTHFSAGKIAYAFLRSACRQKSEAGTRLNTNIFMLYFFQEATGAIAPPPWTQKLTRSTIVQLSASNRH